MNEPIEKRLRKKYKERPKWAEDFSVEMSEDQHVSRRDFIRYLALVSLGLFTGTLGAALKTFWGKGMMKTAVETGVKLVDKADLEVGGSYAFKIPGTNHPGILVRLDEDRFVAYGQKCSHLQAPVMWKKEEKFHCPCHKGAFDARTGDVLYGPPERPLPKLKLRVTDGEVFFEGIERGRLV